MKNKKEVGVIMCQKVTTCGLARDCLLDEGAWRQTEDLSLIPGPTSCKKRIDSHKLSSDFHTFVEPCEYPLMYKDNKNYNFKIIKYCY